MSYHRFKNAVSEAYWHLSQVHNELDNPENSELRIHHGSAYDLGFELTSAQTNISTAFEFLEKLLDELALKENIPRPQSEPFVEQPYHSFGDEDKQEEQPYYSSGFVERSCHSFGDEEVGIDDIPF